MPAIITSTPRSPLGFQPEGSEHTTTTTTTKVEMFVAAVVAREVVRPPIGRWAVHWTDADPEAEPRMTARPSGASVRVNWHLEKMPTDRSGVSCGSRRLRCTDVGVLYRQRSHIITDIRLHSARQDKHVIYELII